MPLANRRHGVLQPARTAPARQAPPAPPRDPNAPRVRSFFFDVPFDLRGVATSCGAEWSKERRCYVFKGVSIPEPLRPYHGELYSWERLCEDEENGDEPATRPPGANVRLRPHQEQGRDAILKVAAAGRTGFLVADDVGLGKTIETWAAALALPDAGSVLVVCPLAVVAHWRRTIRAMGDGGRRIVVINYDRLKKLFDVPASLAQKAKGRRKGRRVRTQKGIAKYGDPYEFDVIIWDESHRLRNLETARSKLSARLNSEADFRIWLSATAGQNPLELAYLAPILAEATGSRVADLRDYEEWCKGQGIGVTRGAYGKWMWRGSDPENKDPEGADEDLERVRRMLFEGRLPAGIRRSPTDIAGWPEINRILLPVALGAEDRYAYEQAWAEFRRDLGLESTGARDSKNALVVRLRFRQKASLLRTAATVDLANELLDQGIQVAVSVAFRESMEVIREALVKDGRRVALIHGSMTAAEKERQRLDFQHGRATVVVYTVEEGISLHQGEYNDARRANILHDVRWSAIQCKQVEGRTHRDGKFSQIYWMIGERTVEEGIASVVAGRVRSMSRMQGDDGTVGDIEALLSRLAGTSRAA